MKAESKKIKKGHSLVIIALCLICLDLGCGVPPPPTDLEWQNNSEEQARVEVESIPSGAKVYGYSGGNIGSYIGSTPLSIGYMGKSSFDKKVVYCLNCGSINIDETLEIKESNSFMAGKAECIALF